MIIKYQSHLSLRFDGIIFCFNGIEMKNDYINFKSNFVFDREVKKIL